MFSPIVPGTGSDVGDQPSLRPPHQLVPFPQSCRCGPSAPGPLHGLLYVPQTLLRRPHSASFPLVWLLQRLSFSATPACPCSLTWRPPHGGTTYPPPHPTLFWDIHTYADHVARDTCPYCARCVLVPSDGRPRRVGLCLRYLGRPFRCERHGQAPGCAQGMLVA